MDILLAFAITLLVLSAVHRPRGEVRRRAAPHRTPQRRLRYSGTSLGPRMTLGQPRHAGGRS
mgnify:CR=1 FL=1